MPEETKRTSSIDGIASLTAEASSISSTVGAPKLVPRAAVSLQHRQHAGVGVAEDHRAPRADEVDVAVAVGVLDPGALRPRDEERVVRPTERIARTGELTPPGMCRQASS